MSETTPRPEPYTVTELYEMLPRLRATFDMLLGKASSYDDTHRDGWIDRAHAVAHAVAEEQAANWGRNVFHICIEKAEEAVKDARREEIDRLRRSHERLVAGLQRIVDQAYMPEREFRIHYNIDQDPHAYDAPADIARALLAELEEAVAYLRGLTEHARCRKAVPHVPAPGSPEP